MTRNSILTLCLLLITAISQIKAQQVDLQIDPICQPNCSPFIHQWQSDPSICSAIIQSDLQNPIFVLLEVTLNEASLGQVAFAQSEPFELPQGPNQLIINNTNWINYDILEYDPNLEQTILQTGTLPEGSYEICYLFINTQDGNPLGQSCTQFDILFPDPPQLVHPGSLEPPPPVISEEFPNFQFTPINYTLTQVTYQVKVAEVLENQNPQEAFEINPANFETILIDEYQFFYPEDAFPLISGQTYCWGIITLTPEGFPLTDISEVFTFQYVEEPGNEPTEGPAITVLSPGGGCSGSVETGHTSSTIDVTWEALGNFDYFEVYIYENPCGRYPVPTPTPPPPSPPVPTPTPDPNPPPVTTGPTGPTGPTEPTVPTQPTGPTGPPTPPGEPGQPTEPTEPSTGEDLPPLPPGWEWGDAGPYWTGEHPPEPPELPPGWEWGPLRPVYTGIGVPPNRRMHYFFRSNSRTRIFRE